VASSVFLSHARADRSVARQIYQELVKAEIRCWLDEAEILPGESIIGKVEAAIDEMDFLAIILSRTSVNSTWVQAELRLAMTNELQEARVRVVGLLIDDSRVPGFLRDKLYIDLRADFMAGIEQLASFLRGEAPAVPKPKQAVLAEIVENADDELWRRYSTKRLRKSAFAQLLRSLTDDELTAAVAVGARWKGYKQWEGGLIHLIQQKTDSDHMIARRVLRRLVDLGLLELATDLNYSKLNEQAYTYGPALIPLRHFAVRSRMFDFLPPPPPERLSEILAANTSCHIVSDGWYAMSVAEPVPHEDGGGQIKAVVQQYKPERAWIFQSANDRTPEVLNEWRSSSDWSLDPFVSSGNQEIVGFPLARFDDLGVLR